jgi:hypothetical protein
MTQCNKGKETWVIPVPDAAILDEAYNLALGKYSARYIESTESLNNSAGVNWIKFV